MQWLTPGEDRLTVVQIEISTVKVMLVAFFDNRGMVHHEFVPNGLGIGGVVYAGIIQRLLQAIQHRRRDVRNNWVLLHDNAPAHRSAPVQNVLRNAAVESLPHPGYSPDLSPPDYWLFSRLKKMVRGVHYHNANDLITSVNAAIALIPQHDFRSAMDKLPDKLCKCIAVRGDYFEKVA